MKIFLLSFLFLMSFTAFGQKTVKLSGGAESLYGCYNCDREGIAFNEAVEERVTRQLNVLFVKENADVVVKYDYFFFHEIFPDTFSRGDVTTKITNTKTSETKEFKVTCRFTKNSEGGGEVAVSCAKRFSKALIKALR